MRADGGGGASVGPSEAGAGRPAGKNAKIGPLPGSTADCQDPWRGAGWRMAMVLHDAPSTGGAAMELGGGRDPAGGVRSDGGEDA